MKFFGEVRGISTDWSSGEPQITFSIKDKHALLDVDQLRGKLIEVKAEPFKAKKTDLQRKYFWECIETLSHLQRLSQWETYIRILDRYGESSRQFIRADAFQQFKAQWRDVKEIGEATINGVRYIECFCYFGISKYNIKELADLIDRVCDEIVMDGGSPPVTREMLRLLECNSSKV